jgi:hypothetical protein
MELNIGIHIKNITALLIKNKKNRINTIITMQSHKPSFYDTCLTKNIRVQLLLFGNEPDLPKVTLTKFLELHSCYLVSEEQVKGVQICNRLLSMLSLNVVTLLCGEIGRFIL